MTCEVPGTACLPCEGHTGPLRDGSIACLKGDGPVMRCCVMEIPWSTLGKAVGGLTENHICAE